LGKTLSRDAAAVTTLEKLRAIEDWLEQAAERGESLAEARQTVSRQIVGFELRELLPDRSLEFYLAEAAAFERTK